MTQDQYNEAFEAGRGHLVDVEPVASLTVSNFRGHLTNHAISKAFLDDAIDAALEATK